MEFTIGRAGTSAKDLEAIEKLMKNCFPGNSQHLSVEYLRWLYCDNPAGPLVGMNAVCATRGLVGHYATIPVKGFVEGKPELGLLSLNTATHPVAQGKGLFTTLAKKTYEAAEAEGFKFVVGVANQNSTHGFKKRLGFQLVSQLDVKIGFGNPWENRDGATKSRFRLSRDPKIISWRLNRPKSKYRLAKSNGVVFAETSIPALHIAIGHFEPNLVKEFSALPERHSIFPVLWVGLNPGSTWKGKVYFDLPEKLKPSPLNLIFLDLTGKDRKLAREDVEFEAMDFDAF